MGHCMDEDPPPSFTVLVAGIISLMISYGSDTKYWNQVSQSQLLYSQIIITFLLILKENHSKL